MRFLGVEADETVWYLELFVNSITGAATHAP